ncbi:10482_t:CDS:1, partial [Entrophospora sp. SA101]
TALIKTLRELGYQDFNMRLISKLASDFWNHEPEYVQAAYK